MAMARGTKSVPHRVLISRFAPGQRHGWYTDESPMNCYGRGSELCSVVVTRCELGSLTRLACASVQWRVVASNEMTRRFRDTELDSDDDDVASRDDRRLRRASIDDIRCWAFFSFPWHFVCHFRPYRVRIVPHGVMGKQGVP